MRPGSGCLLRDQHIKPARHLDPLRHAALAFLFIDKSAAMTKAFPLLEWREAMSWTRLHGGNQRDGGALAEEAFGSCPSRYHSTHRDDDLLAQYVFVHIQLAFVERVYPDPA